MGREELSALGTVLNEVIDEIGGWRPRDLVLLDRGVRIEGRWWTKGTKLSRS